MTAHRCLASNQVRNLNRQRMHCLIFVSSTPGESPPPAPRACFGRDGLIKKIVDLTEDLTPIALVGVGGIGKTSIALTVLHHDSVKRRFGDNRRFIRCDQFPSSRIHLLSRLSKAIGAGIKNPEDLASLRPFLSSQKMMIVLDNAESILDPRGADAQEIYAVVDELSQFDNICLCITSRISTTPDCCETLDIPTLSIEAAREAFCWIYKSGGQSDLVDNILEQLDFHPLSITLLATVGYHSRWDMERLTKEWERRRTSVLRTEHNKSLAATIELSLASPMFQRLGPDARALLEVIAFFPQGISEENVDWLIPTISNGNGIFDKFCMLSLTHRSDGFVTMLAPLRDYLLPKDLESTSLVHAIRSYCTRVLIKVDPCGPTFGETRWIVSEDINVEHLLDVFTTIDPSLDILWEVCASFMQHLIWHKNRLVVLGPKIEGLPDDHRFKPECLFKLSRLSYLVGNHAECKRLLNLTLRLWRERGNDYEAARTLRQLSSTDRLTGLHKEGIRQAREALEIHERLGAMAKEALEICERLGTAERGALRIHERLSANQAACLNALALSLREDGQLDAAEEAGSRAISLLPEKGQELQVCEAHLALANVYRSKGKTKKAIHHFGVALGIASSFGWNDRLFWIYHSMGGLCLDEGGFDGANVYVERAKSHAANNVCYLGIAMELQATVWCEQRRFEEARSEALSTAELYEALGIAGAAELCRTLAQRIQQELDRPVVSSRSVTNCEFCQ